MTVPTPDRIAGWLEEAARAEQEHGKTTPGMWYWKEASPGESAGLRSTAQYTKMDGQTYDEFVIACGNGPLWGTDEDRDYIAHEHERPWWEWLRAMAAMIQVSAEGVRLNK